MGSEDPALEKWTRGKKPPPTRKTVAKSSQLVDKLDKLS